MPPYAELALCGTISTTTFSARSLQCSLCSSVLEAKDASQSGMRGQRTAQPLEVAGAQRDGTTPRRASCRVGEAHEFVAFLIGEELDYRRETLLARALRHGQLLDHL